MGKAYDDTEYPYLALTGKHEKVLLLTPTQRKAYLELPTDLRPAVSVYEHTSTVGADTWSETGTDSSVGW